MLCMCLVLEKILDLMLLIKVMLYLGLVMVYFCELLIGIGGFLVFLVWWEVVDKY